MDNYNSVYVNHLNQELAGSLPGWTVVRQIGKGAYGEVYEIHRTTGNFLEKAALKVLRIPKNSTEAKHLQFQGASAEEAEDYYREYVDNTLKEIALMQRLVGNSYIVSYEDYAVRKRENSIGWDIYIRMELLTSLPDYLKIHPAEEDMVLQLGMDISRGLWDCHREGIIHRDIKPQNIFVNQSGGFKIGDFGVARFTPGSQGNLSFKGTIAYMAPEVFYQKGTDARSDIYSLGMVMYQCLNDYRLPFFPRRFTPEDVDRARKIRLSGEAVPAPAHGSAELWNVVRKALEPDPNDRYQTAEEMYAVLEDIHRNREKGTDEAAFVSADDFYKVLEEEAEAGQGHYMTEKKEADDDKILPDPSFAKEGDSHAQGDKNVLGRKGNQKNSTEIKNSSKKKNSIEIKNSSKKKNNSKIKNRRSGTRIFGIAAAVLIIMILIFIRGRSPGIAEGMAESEKETEEETGTGYSGATLNSSAADTTEDFEDYVIDWKDKGLETRMRKITGIYGRAIKYSDVYDITELDLAHTVTEVVTIRDISALENLTSLTKLTLYGNQISDISPLTSLTALTYLDLSENRITDISPISNLPSLTELNLSRNRCDDISSVSSLPSLTKLDLSFNKIEDLSPLGRLTALTELNLYQTYIEDISPLSNLTALTILYLNSNQISDISPLSNLTSLTYLEIFDNQISDISPLENLSSLTYLQISGNQISDISPLRNLTSLTVLSLRNNEIRDVSPLSNLTALTELELTANKISDISALSSLTALKKLDLTYNEIRDISALSSMTALADLDISGSEISDISALSGLTALKELMLSDNNISDISAVSNLTKLNNLTLSGNNISDISPVSGLYALEVLNLDGNNISDLSSISNLILLRTLCIHKNQIHDISPLSTLIKLQYLNISDNPIEDYSPIENMNIETVIK